MATRQYIGARYVIKVYENSLNPASADWEGGVTYEPLTMVTYLNSSYLSKKEVPGSIGDPVNNPAYWVVTGAYNGQILNLQNQIDAINNVLDLISSRKFAIITDSYGSTFGGTITPFNEVFKTEMGLVEGVNYCASSLDGAGFVSDGVRLFSTAITNLANNMPSPMTTNDVTDLLILGGCNDAAISSGIPAAISSTVSDAKTLFPNAKIYIGIIGGIDTLARRKQFLENVVPTYLNCGDYGAYPLQNLQYVMTRSSYFQSDLVHPNQTGMNAIARALVAAVGGGYMDFGKKENVTVAGNPGVTSASMTFDVYPNNDTINIMMSGSGSFSCGALSAGNIVIGKYTSDLFKGNVDNWILAHVNFFGNDAGKVLVNIIFNNGDLIMYLPTNKDVTGFTLERLSLSQNRLLC